MIKLLALIGILMLAVPIGALAQEFESDLFDISGGSLKLTFIGSLMFEFQGKTIYVSPYSKLSFHCGRDGNFPEMSGFKGIEIAFLPMDLPYTMSPEMVADTARSFRPKILYPYRFGETDTSKIVDLPKDEKEIEIRIRKMN